MSMKCIVHFVSGACVSINLNKNESGMKRGKIYANSDGKVLISCSECQKGISVTIRDVIISQLSHKLVYLFILVICEFLLALILLYYVVVACFPYGFAARCRHQ